jgi:uncharacterized MAPEG superfamily protein
MTTAPSLTPELAALAAIALLQVIMIVIAQRALTADIGVEGNTGPRDGAMALSVRSLRLRRAVDNHVENIGLFIIACVVVTLSGQADRFTGLCAWIYVAARLLYLPAYAFGWTPWRSVIWMIGLAATLAMLVAAFL